MTQLAEVAVNSPVKKPALCPSRDAMGRVSSSAPARMITAKEAATMRVALRLLPRTNQSRSQRAHLLSTVGSSSMWKSFDAEKHAEEGGSSGMLLRC